MRLRLLLSALFCAWLLTSIPPASAERMGVVAPAYQYPTLGTLWADLAAAAPRVPVIAILNPGNGPGTSVDPTYTAAVGALRAAGGKVYGYVYSSYTARADSAVLADAARFLSFYPLDGFFVDEVTADASPAHLAYYATLVAGLRSLAPALPVMGNPGVSCDEAYADASRFDQLVTFEHHAGYESWLPAPWAAARPPSRFVNLLYARRTDTSMIEAVRLAASRNVAHVFVTHDSLPNPWDSTPSYWLDELAVIETTTVAASALSAGATPQGVAPRAQRTPARGLAWISFGPNAHARTLSLFDAHGRRVRQLRVEPGTRAAAWDGGDERGAASPTGLYFARFEGETPSARVVWLR